MVMETDFATPHGFATETELKCRDEDPLRTWERLAAPFCL